MKKATIDKRSEVLLLQSIFPHCKPKFSSKTLTWTYIKGSKADVYKTLIDSGWIKMEKKTHSGARFENSDHPNIRILVDEALLKVDQMNVMITSCESKV